MMAKLIVCTGSMFSGKTKELQRLGQRQEIAGRKVLYCKPEIDDRYKKGKIVSHDKSEVSAMELKDIRLLGYLVNDIVEKPHMVCIDEVQFFDAAHTIKIINDMLMLGVDVVVAGLDMDRNMKPFGAMPTLMCLAEEVKKFNAVCSDCGEDAWISYGETAEENQIVVGEKDIYKPLCRNCFYERGGIL
jgi:thymidine kinase